MIGTHLYTIMTSLSACNLSWFLVSGSLSWSLQVPNLLWILCECHPYAKIFLFYLIMISNIACLKLWFKDKKNKNVTKRRECTINLGLVEDFCGCGQEVGFTSIGSK